jgi:hypothetical protein
MNNQEALIAGVSAWMDANRDLIVKTYYRAMKDSIDEISLMIGTQVAARCGRFLEENKQDLVSGMQLQLAVNEIIKNPKYITMIGDLNGITEPAVDRPEEKNEPDSK